MKVRAKRTLIALGTIVLLFGGTAAVAPRLLFGDRTDYSHVVSITGEPTYQDPALLAQAFALPAAAAYQQGGLEYQRNLSFCGPSTAVDILRSLGTAADQGHVLVGTGIRSAFGIVWGGLTLDEEADLLRKKTGRRVTVLRDLDLPGFRAELRHANHPGRRYAVNFARGPLFGRGGGHHSTVGAYLEGPDLVLVLDVNREYQPWLLHTDRLFAAVDTVDRQSGLKRGLLRVE
jgi:hypothetical protein